MMASMIGTVGSRVDPNWQYVKSLIHFDGANASTSIIDQRLHPVTAYGNAQLSTAQKKFGVSSLLLDGTGDYALITNHADFELGSSDFTIECQYYPIANSQYASIVSKYVNGGFSGWSLELYRAIAGRPSFVTTTNGTSWNVSIESTVEASLNTWHHLEIDRSGNNFYLFLDGVLVGSTAVAGSITTSPTAGISIGSFWGGDYPSNMYFDEFKFTKGIAKHTSGFTPPTAPYTNY
jgi:hypothetical protein